MSEEKALWAGIFQEYFFWFSGIFFSSLAGAFYLGYSIQTLDSRVIASETAIKDINEELRLRIGIRAEIMTALGNLNARVSHIEGQNELILKKIQ